MIKNKEISSAELTKSVFDRIKAVEGKVDAYLTLDEENAMKKAAEIDEKLAKGEELSPLAGIPVGIKDNISTKGLRTTCASKMLGNYVPPFNATVMNKLDDIVVTGKLNMDEFAMGSSTENSHFKPTKNPFDTERIPGGSSGGSAAAVAAREAIVTLGSDTGGSMVQSAIVGHDKYDATSSYREYPDFAADLKADVKGLRIGIPKEYFGEGIDPFVKQSVMNAVKELEKQGATVKEISLPSTDYALSSYYIISSAEASSNLARFDGVRYGFRAEEYDGLVDMYERTRSEGFGDEVKRRIMLGTFVLSSGFYDAYYKKAKLVQKRIMQEFAAQFADVDVIATPTVPSTAFKIGENTDDPLKMYANDVCTVTVNIAGLPAISIPCAYDDKGLPVGMQLIGGKFTEQRLLNTAYAYEQLVGGFKMPEL